MPIQSADAQTLPESPYLTPPEAARLLRVNVRTIQRMCTRGELVHIRINRRGDCRIKKGPDGLPVLSVHTATAEGA